MSAAVTLALAVLATLLATAATGVMVNAWRRPRLAKADAVDLSARRRSQRNRQTVDRTQKRSRDGIV